MLSPADEQPRPVPGSDGKLLRTRHLEQTKKTGEAALGHGREAGTGDKTKTVDMDLIRIGHYISEIFYNFGCKGKGAAQHARTSTAARCKRKETARGSCRCKTIDWNRIDPLMHLPGRVRDAGDVASRLDGWSGVAG